MVEPSLAAPAWFEPTLARWRRLRRSGRLAHGWLITGRMGDGLPELAERLVADLLCLQPAADGAACGQCRACALLSAGTHPDLFRLTPPSGKTQIHVAQIRELSQMLALHSQLLGARAGLICTAEAMSGAAANALLKTLEEPPAGSFLLLLSEHPARLPATIRSRCQRLAVPVPAFEAARDWLLAHGVEPAQAQALLAVQQGAAYDALRLAKSPQDAELLTRILPDLEACLQRQLAVSDWAGRYAELPPDVLWPLLYRWLAEHLLADARQGGVRSLRPALRALSALSLYWQGQSMNLNRQLLLEDWLTRLILPAA